MPKSNDVLSGKYKVAIALSLYMGVTASEICALRYADIDTGRTVATISKRMYNQRNHESVFIEYPKRSIPISSIICEMMPVDVESRRYLLSGRVNPVSTVRKGVNIIARELRNRGVNKSIHLDHSYAAFIRRLLESGVNIQTVSELTGMNESFDSRRRKLGIGC